MLTGSYISIAWIKINPRQYAIRYSVLPCIALSGFRLRSARAFRWTIPQIRHCCMVASILQDLQILLRIKMFRLDLHCYIYRYRCMFKTTTWVNTIDSLLMIEPLVMSALTTGTCNPLLSLWGHVFFASPPEHPIAPPFHMAMKPTIWGRIGAHVGNQAPSRP